MTPLDTRYLGLDLSSPVVASSSPLTGSIDTLLELEDAGVAAVVLPSLFEEQVEHEAMALHAGLEFGAEGFAEAPAGYLPEMDDYNTGPSLYVDLVQRAKEELSIPVIASLNGSSPGGWTLYGRVLEDSGVDAIELNMYLIAADPTESSETVEHRYLDLIAGMRKTIDLPLAVKIGPYFSSTANMAVRMADAGADALVMFNRFYQPDIDLEHLGVAPALRLSSPVEGLLTLRWLAILRDHLSIDLAATTGVHDAEDALKAVLAGANVTMMASSLLRNGPGHVTNVIQGMQDWLTEREYESIDQARGSLSQENTANPLAFERANYLQTLASWSSE